MTFLGYNLKEIRKAVVGFLTFLVTLASVATSLGGIIPAEWALYVSLFVNVCGMYGIYKVPNDKWRDITAEELAASDYVPEHRADY